MTQSRLVHLVDQQTGEVLGEDIINPQSQVISENQRQAYKKKLEKERDNRHFSFADMENIKEVISKLTNVYLGYLLQLQCHMEFGTGFLIGKDGAVMTKKVDIEHTLGITNSTNKRLCKALESNGVLEEVKGGYRINPAYHFRGQGQAQEQKIIKLFTTTLKQLCKILKPAEIGFLYKLLPYVHYGTNMICINPHEIDSNEIKYLNIEAIAQITEIHQKKISTLLRGLRKGGIIAETILEDKRHTFITLNPYIFYRKSGQPDNTLRGMFAASSYAPKK
ncbi:hypothetical protein COF67_27345 [Bacillus toyonensis]|uniref:hypothetical protein n=1 Tax=Bacillus toyonensis TaxID=155322 RepID=UPI000BFDCCEC|nr:hypothetical protein [Bacillus toyonensis]PHD43196.1 hypothetical protein COF67_27345 [Bacillus toyonensis]